MRKQYLGDGVYVETERGMLKLTTENGPQVTNTIYLEPAVYVALTQYFQRATRRDRERPSPTAPGADQG